MASGTQSKGLFYACKVERLFPATSANTCLYAADQQLPDIVTGTRTAEIYFRPAIIR